ncbi:hypothetical protein N5C46_10395 [Rossellomorea vietnamensis]|uniref:Uncharacterized protein n=1 Tax=Rossellomorea vietnamensis TaxID=218284 RepID=A0ACD4CCL7_9BACI|nr:hypothetical protein [Rossellomorea vietnamensis]UXH46424.1 hypothetical protein N5C46_10395 [Rossellomorea vietnamensis]
MKKFIIYSIIIMLLTGCMSDPVEKKALNENVQDLLLKSKLNYLDSDFESGFTNNEKPDLNNTYWVVKILDTYNIKIHNKDGLVSWIDKINTDELMLDGDERSESEGKLMKYLYLKDQFDISNENRKEIINYLEKTNSLIQLGNNKEANEVLILSKKYLNLSSFGDFDHKDLLEKAINDKVVYYAYLYHLLGHDISKDTLNQLNNNIEIGDLNFQSLLDLYYLKQISGKDFTHTVKSKEVKMVIEDYMNNKVNTEFLFYFLSVFEDSISEKDKKVIIDFLVSMSLENGWSNPSSTINLAATEQGITIANHYHSVDYFNKPSLQKFLDSAFVEIKNDWEYLFLYLPSVVNSYKIVEDETKLEEIKEFTVKSLEKEINKETLNPSIILILLETANNLGVEKDVKRFVNEDIQIALYEFVEENYKEENDYVYLYLNVLLNRFSAKNASNINTKLIPQNTYDTYMSLRINQISQKQLIKIDEEKTRKKLQDTVDSSKVPDEIFVAIKALDIIGEGEEE